MKHLRSVFVVLVALAVGAFGGYTLRHHRALGDEATLSLSHHMSSAASEQFVLLMLEQGRTAQLIPVLEQRLADDLKATRTALPSVPSMPWVVWPNLIESVRRSGQYFQRVGRHPEATADALSIAAAMAPRATPPDAPHQR